MNHVVHHLLVGVVMLRSSGIASVHSLGARFKNWTGAQSAVLSCGTRLVSGIKVDSETSLSSASSLLPRILTNPLTMFFASVLLSFIGAAAAAHTITLKNNCGSGSLNVWLSRLNANFIF